MNEKEKEFYLNCAIAAMQGLQESSNKFVSDMSEVFVKETAELSFRLAGAMLEEARKHIDF